MVVATWQEHAAHLQRVPCPTLKGIQSAIDRTAWSEKSISKLTGSWISPIVDALEKSGFIDFVYKGYLFTTASVLHTLTAFPVEIGSDDFLIHSHASVQPHPNLYGLDVLFSRACHPRPVDLTRLVLQDVYTKCSASSDAPRGALYLGVA